MRERDLQVTDGWAKKIYGPEEGVETWGQTQKVHEKEMSDEEARRKVLDEREKELEMRIKDFEEKEKEAEA